MKLPAPAKPMARWRSSGANMEGRIDCIKGSTMAPLAPITTRMRMRPPAEVIWLATTEEIPNVTRPIRSMSLRPYRSPSTPAGSMNPASDSVYAADIHWSSSVVAPSLAERVGRAVIRIVTSRPSTRPLMVSAARPTHRPFSRVISLAILHLQQHSMLSIIRVTSNIKRLALLAGALLGATGCVAGAAGTTAAPPPHVFVIVMENHSAAEALAGPFAASLAARYGVANNYYAVAHPSVPNYLALTSGQTWGVTDDSYRVLPKVELGDQLTTAHVSWKAYMEGFGPSGCLDSPVPYDPGHNPFAYYGGACPGNVVPLTAQAADLAGATPRFSWITPDRCHDGHDCSVTTGDAWLRQEVGAITSSGAWKSNGVLFITWDEDDESADNHVLTLVVTPGAGHRVSSVAYTHYSLLATVEDLLGVGRLANAAHAAPMDDLLKS